MRRLAFLAVLSMMLIAPASAEVTRPMSAHPTSGELKTACGNAGGDFVDNTDIDPNGGYSCTHQNCDGKGGNCTVSCGTKGCAGTTPAIISFPVTLLGLLQNGNMVNHTYQSLPDTTKPKKPDTAAPPSGGGAGTID
jgi:hypothetical protein